MLLLEGKGPYLSQASHGIGQQRCVGHALEPMGQLIDTALSQGDIHDDLTAQPPRPGRIAGPQRKRYRLRWPAGAPVMKSRMF